MDFVSILALEQHGPDTHVGVGPQYPWGGLYGGQIVAQALAAAAASVDEGFHPHSLHAYFIRPGDHHDPVRYEVDRLRNGRSFATRRVVARQAIGAILNLSASFQRDEEQADVSASSPPADLPDPETLGDDGWSAAFQRRFVPTTAPGHAMAWLKVDDDLGDDRLLHAAGLAYVSDDLPTDAVVRLHPEPAREDDFDRHFMTASLDHAIWFHHPMRADDWHLHEFRCESLQGARGHTVGKVFDRSGRLVATVAQEVLLRRRRDRPAEG